MNEIEKLHTLYLLKEVERYGKEQHEREKNAFQKLKNKFTE